MKEFILRLASPQKYDFVNMLINFNITPDGSLF